MARGKYAKATPKRKRHVALLLCIAVLFTFAVSSTLAYIVTSTSSVHNQFLPASVTFTVDDNYRVTNTGNVNAYVRAAVVANWVDTQGNILTSGPADASSYLSFDTGWSESDGFYYYNSAITPTGDTSQTSPLVRVGNVPAGYELRVDVMVEIIQTAGMGAGSAQSAWAIASGNNS